MSYGCDDLNKTDGSLEATFRPEQKSNNYRSFQEQNISKNEFKKLTNAGISDETPQKDLKPIVNVAGKISRSPTREDYQSMNDTSSGWFKSDTFIRLQKEKFNGSKFNSQNGQQCLQ